MTRLNNAIAFLRQPMHFDGVTAEVQNCAFFTSGPILPPLEALQARAAELARERAEAIDVPE